MRRDNSMAIIQEHDRDTVNATIAAAVANHTAYQCEFRINDPAYKDAGFGDRWMVSRGRVGYDASGNAVRMFGITLEITAQKRGEVSLRQANEALERSNIELQRFAHVASHDLQTPMRSVASFVELLQMKYAAQLDAQGQDWMRRILQSVSDLQTLVKDLLQYSRVDSQVRPFADTDMGAVFDRVVVLLDAAISESNAQITRTPLPTVRGDATQLAELLLNLMTNALKYRGREAPSVQLTAERGSNEWRFAVRDNGIGIAARHHERVFEIFQRLHNQQQYPGTGIGLAICRRVVQRHGGRIWLASEPGCGSVFYFTIPDRVESP
jgi:light-regulated signal transduction histidine kinase (bacteriophytochrome)